MKKKAAPIYLDLPRFKWPWTAIISILHRGSGLLLYFLVAPLVYLFHLSTENEAGFQAVHALFSSPFITVFLFLCLWGLLHHLFSGIRFLLIDFDIGVSKEKAQSSAKIITLSSAAVALIWIIGLL